MKVQTLGRQIRVLTILLVLIPSLLVMVIYTISQIKIAKQKNLEQISQRVYSQERLIDYWIAERLTDVRKLSQLDDFRRLNHQQMNDTLQIIQQGSKNFDSLSYVDKDGSFKLSTLSTGIKHTSASQKPYFKASLAGKEYISDVIIGRNSNLPIINFSSPIFDYDGNFQGLVLGSVRTTTLEILLHDNSFG